MEQILAFFGHSFLCSKYFFKNNIIITDLEIYLLVETWKVPYSWTPSIMLYYGVSPFDNRFLFNVNTYLSYTQRL